MTFICDDCDRLYVYKRGLVKHVTTFHKPGRSRMEIVRRRLRYFNNRSVPEELPEQENLWTPPSREQLLAEGYDQASLGVIRENWRFIGTNYRRGRILNRFNVRLKPGSFDMANVSKIIRAIHSLQTRGYKLNLTWGCLLYHQVEKKFRYFWGGNSSNFNLFYPRPIAVNKTEDLEKHLQYLDQTDLVEFISQCRTDTKWVLHSVLNLTVLVYSTADIAAPLMGGGGRRSLDFVLVVPNYLKVNRFVHLQLRHKSGEYFNDGLCLFRALASHFAKGKVKKLQASAKALANQFSAFVGVQLREILRDGGIKMEDLFACEKCFQIRIFVYSLTSYDESNDESESQITDTKANDMGAVLVRKSSQKCQLKGDVYLDLSHLTVEGTDNVVEHLSWISSITHYCKKFFCANCGYTTPKCSNHKRHVAACVKRDNRTRARCPKSASYNLPMTVFDRLKLMGFEVGDGDKFVDYYSSYDWESFSRLYSDDELPFCQGSKLHVSAKLELMACSLTSSVDGFKRPTFFLRQSTEYELMSRVLDYMTSIADKSFELMQIKLKHLFAKLKGAQLTCTSKIVQNSSSITDYESSSQKLQEDTKQFYICKQDELTQIEKQLLRHCKRHCFYAFNGSKFDVRLMRDTLVNCLMDRGIEIEGVLKRDQAYIVLSTASLVFKDAASLVGPGVSLDSLGRSMDLKVAKGCFPFDWLKTLDQLQSDRFPEHSDFYNSLKQQNVTTEVYNEMKELFESCRPRTMATFLEKYTNLDVEVLQLSLGMLFQFWRDQGFDPVSEAVSLPGLSAKLVYKMASKRRGIIWMPSTNKQLELYDLFSKGMIGGPSIVWLRAACADVTKIRGDGEIVKSIIGMDANALYLKCIGSEMPTGPVCDWKLNSELGLFTKYWCLPPNSSMGELELVTFMQYKLQDGCYLMHRWNYGQVRLGSRRYSWDAIHFGLMIAVSYDGCRYHFCQLCPAGIMSAEENPGFAEKRRAEDEYRHLYVQSLGFRHIRISECHWRQLKTENKEIKSFLNDTLITPLFHKYKATEAELIKGISDKRLFGVCEVSLSCESEDLMEKLKECSPIFIHFSVGREHLSEHMRESVEKSGALKNPRKCLIGVRSAENQVMPSQLVAWYVSQGMKVKLHRFIQSKPCAMFTEFVNTITHFRSKADSDPKLSILASLWKLAGNSCYGKFLEKVENHTKTVMCNEKKAGRLVNFSNFRHLEPLGEQENWSSQRFECHLLPHSYVQKTARQLALFILGLAKLSLLEFVYSFLRKFWLPKDWSIVYCDTDSWYLCLSAPTWSDFEKRVKPELQEEFEVVRKKFIAYGDTKRTPGLFKEEFLGEAIICLNSKTYIAIEKITPELSARFEKLIALGGGKQEGFERNGNCDSNVGKTKISSKGLSKNQNKELLTADSFLSVLESEKAIGGRNQGFMFRQGGLYRFSMDRQSLSYTYIKRKLDKDGITASEPII